jgi:hypothetical protein
MSTCELVPSVSIANMVNQRAAVMGRLDQAIGLIREAAEIANEAHLGMPRFSVGTGYGRNYGDHNINTATAGADRNGARSGASANEDAGTRKLLRLGIDCGAWQYLMTQSGLRSMMDAAARAKWDKAIGDGDVPELNDANIRSTFKMLHDSRGEMFERGVVAVFKGLAWCYKTNLPQKFGKRIVIKYLRSGVSGGMWGANSLGSIGSFSKTDALDDLTRVFSVLDGKPEHDVRNGWYGRVSNCRTLNDPDPADDYMVIRCFRNGNGHVTFKRLNLVDKMNLIIAKHYPGALPAPK